MESFMMLEIDREVVSGSTSAKKSKAPQIQLEKRISGL
jgi:hypothetical protein